MVLGFASVTADTITGDVKEEISVPLEHVTSFSYGPAGFKIIQPEAISNTTLGEVGDRQVFIFYVTDEKAVTIDATKTNLSLSDAFESWKSVTGEKDSYSLVSEDEITIGGEPAYQVEYSYQDDANEKQEQAIITVHNGIVYVIQSDSGASEAVKSSAQSIIDSFEFIPVEDDNISKMVKSKMKKLTEPGKYYLAADTFACIDDFGYGWWGGRTTTTTTTMREINYVDWGWGWWY